MLGNFLFATVVLVRYPRKCFPFNQSLEGQTTTQSIKPCLCCVHTHVGGRIPPGRCYVWLEISAQCNSVIKPTPIVLGEPQQYVIKSKSSVKSMCSGTRTSTVILLQVFSGCVPLYAWRLQCSYFTSNVCLPVHKETPLPSVTWFQNADFSPTT